MTLDILTPKGQETLIDEKRAVELWYSRYPEYKYCETNKDTSADIDAILVRDSIIEAVIETKCRYNISLDSLKNKFNYEWLVTTKKLEKGKGVASSLRVPLLGFLYLVNDDVLLCIKLWDNEKGWIPNIKEKTTRTQSTINGGSIMRLNSYIDMSKSKMIKGF
jgi:hypothetical protein